MKTKTRMQKIMDFLKRSLIRVIIFVLVMGIFGTIYQTAATESDSLNFPPPGNLIDVDGFKMHIHCEGTGSPTVILESMSGGTSTYWGWIQPEVQKETRVCIYDRAGFGWSESDPEALTLARTVRNLHTLCCFWTTLSPLLLLLPGATQAQPTIPTASAGFGVQNNSFGFEIFTTNALAAVESCTNLASPVWLELSTNVLNSGSGYFADTDWTNYPRRFYRANNLGDGLYSTNIVGFVRLVVHPDYNLLANPLSVGFTNGANEVLPPIEGAQILTWNGTRFDYVSYDTGFGGWIDANWNPASPPLLPPGKGLARCLSTNQLLAPAPMAE